MHGLPLWRHSRSKLNYVMAWNISIFHPNTAKPQARTATSRVSSIPFCTEKSRNKDEGSKYYSGIV